MSFAAAVRHLLQGAMAIGYENLMQQAPRWLGDLPPAVARRIAWDNGAALFGLPAT